MRYRDRQEYYQDEQANSRLEYRIQELTRRLGGESIERDRIIFDQDAWFTRVIVIHRGVPYEERFLTSWLWEDVTDEMVERWRQERVWRSIMIRRGIYHRDEEKLREYVRYYGYDVIGEKREIYETIIEYYTTMFEKEIEQEEYMELCEIHGIGKSKKKVKYHHLPGYDRVCVERKEIDIGVFGIVSTLMGVPHTPGIPSRYGNTARFYNHETDEEYTIINMCTENLEVVIRGSIRGVHIYNEKDHVFVIDDDRIEGKWYNMIGRIPMSVVYEYAKIYDIGNHSERKRS